MSEEKIRTDANEEDQKDELTSGQLEEVAGGGRESLRKSSLEEGSK